MYKFIPAFHVANTVSLVGLFFSLWSMKNLFNGNTDLAIILFVLSGLCDLFDGKFARIFKRNAFHRQMGEYIDSFVDMVSFVALPIVFLLHFISGPILPLILAFFYAICGIHRLGYFHIMKDTDFIGVPVTYITLAVTVTYTIFHLFDATGSSLFQASIILLFILMPLGFVWNRPVQRPTSKMYVLFVVLAIFVLVVIGSRL